ncbi:MAG: ABC transporter ATP-binding protein [Anaerolineales bacterium]
MSRAATALRSGVPRAAQGGEPLIKLRSVRRTFPSPSGGVDALIDLDLTVWPGEYVGVIGKSGAGKTTLLSLISGVDHPNSGEIWVDGTPIHELDEDELAIWRGRRVGVVYQSFHLMPTLTLLDNVLLPMDLSGLYRGRASVDRAHDLLEQVGLAEHALKTPAAISGGQQQRVAIARALANDPALIVADEPTGRLDSTTADEIFDVFRAQVERGGKTVLMVTHDQTLARKVDRVVQLDDGRVRDQAAGRADVTLA